MSLLLLLCLSALVAAGALGHHLRLSRLKLRLSEARAALTRQMREAERLRLATDHASDGILLQRADGTIAWLNPAYERIMGRPAEEMLGRHPLSFALPASERPDAATLRCFRLNPDDPAAARLQLHRHLRGDGTAFWNQTSTSFRRGPTGAVQAVVVCRDVTEQIEHAEKLRETRRQLEHAARHDPLTGLPNRAELMRFAKEALAHGGDGAYLGLLHIDLDKFKEINDTHGHGAGDEALRHCAAAMSRTLRDTDLVARVGGDEFVAVCPEVIDHAALQALAADLAVAISTPFDYGGRRLSCRASIGAALSEPGVEEAEVLLLRSDFALYEAKRRGRNRTAVYDARLHQSYLRQTRRGTTLQEALREGHLAPRFHPVCDARSREVLGFETRIAWEHPEEGLVSGTELLALASDLGLGVKLELDALDSTLILAERLKSAGRGHLYTTFNASAQLLRHPEFLPRLAEGVRRRGIPPERFVIDVSETMLLGDCAETEEDEAGGCGVLQLREAGFVVMLDRFGAEHAGLTHLARLPVHGVKIAPELVGRVAEDPTHSKILGIILELCTDLGLAAVVEGVETREVAQRLVDLGYRYAQGPWFGPALSAEMAVLWEGTPALSAPLRARA